MICDFCKKNEATIHIKEIVGSEKKSLNLCSECAKNHNKEGAKALGDFNLADIIYNLSGEQKQQGSQPQQPAQESKLVCPKCQWSLADLRRTGRLGCAQCYETFHNVIFEALGNMHHGKVHCGKRPTAHQSQMQGADAVPTLSPEELAQNEIDILTGEIESRQTALDAAIKAEEYESAAQLRDQIKLLKLKIEAKKAAHAQEK